LASIGATKEQHEEPFCVVLSRLGWF